MCGECNESENVEPSEDLNTVNVHDGTWRIPEHERTPVQQSAELPVPPVGYRWAVEGETVVRGSQYCGPNGAILWACNASVGDVVSSETRCGGFYAIPENILLPNSPQPIVPPVVSEVDDSKPIGQRTLDTILMGVRSGCLHSDGQRYETALETMARLFPNGYGIDEHGAMFSLGFTGKRKALTPGQLKEYLNRSYSSNEFVTLLQNLGKQFPPKIKTANGEGIQDVFEKYRPGSCMSGCGCRDMREIYACNPDSVGTVYSVRDPAHNPLIESSCSALFWIGTKRIYLDRMYSQGVHNIYVQYDWFADHLETVYGKPCVTIYTSTKQRRQYDKTITFKLKDSGNALPYIDSLYTVKRYDGKHVWLTSDENGGDIHCRDTAGTYPDGRDRCQCSECGCRMDDDDARHHGDETYCEDCYSDQFSHCEWTEEDYPTDEVQSVECWCYGSRYRERNSGGRNGYSLGWHTLAISDDALSAYFTELSDGRYASNGNTVEDNRGSVHASDCDSWDSVTLTEDGDLYHTDDVVQLSDGRTYPVDECIEVDEEWYLSGDEPEQETDDDDSADDVSENEETEQQAEDVPSGYRRLSVGETIQAGDYCAGYRGIDPRNRWFITGDEGVTVRPESLVYVRLITSEQQTPAQKEMVTE